MNVSEQWVERLALATDYEQLHEVFASMAAAARSTDEPERLAGSIGEAVLRLRQERARDEDELKEVAGQYEQFKAGQSGVFGWLRRHVPFTETRQQDKTHRAEVAEQEAEILADNLIIARAQVLREALLPPAKRRLGDDPEDWERRLVADERVTRLKAYAQGVVALANELRTGTAFVKEVQTDIDAFAKAKFKDKEDLRRKKEDLAAAKEELAGIERNLKSKQGLRDGAVSRLRELIREELETNDPSFRALSRHAALLDEAHAEAEGVAIRLETMRAAFAGMQEIAAKFEGLDAKRLDLVHEGGRLREAVQAAERRHVQADTLASERARRAAEAHELWRQAEAVVLTARAAHAAHLAASGQVEMPEGATFEESSQAARELVEAERALEEVRASKQAAEAPHEAARSEAQAAQQELRETESSLEKRQQAEEALEREERELRDDLRERGDALRTLVQGTPAVVERYAAMLERLDRHSGLADSRDRFIRRRRFELSGDDAVPESAADLGHAAKRLARLLEGTRAEQEALEEDRAADRRSLDSVWAQRSQELLGNDLASEVF